MKIENENFIYHKQKGSKIDILNDLENTKQTILEKEVKIEWNADEIKSKSILGNKHKKRNENNTRFVLLVATIKIQVKEMSDTARVKLKDKDGKKQQIQEKKRMEEKINLYIKKIEKD